MEKNEQVLVKLPNGDYINANYLGFSSLGGEKTFINVKVFPTSDGGSVEMHVPTECVYMNNIQRFIHIS